MKINFEYSYRYITEQDIKDFEAKYNVQLPEGYKDFLLSHNGGKIDRRRFTTSDENKEGTITSSIMMFFPLSSEIENNLESMDSFYNIGSIGRVIFFL
ncbi:hypothetical protein J2W47_005618 [Priestia megaterium]|nr:hypothetical protein [Priestia megaterium]